MQSRFQKYFNILPGIPSGPVDLSMLILFKCFSTHRARIKMNDDIRFAAGTKVGGWSCCIVVTGGNWYFEANTIAKWWAFPCASLIQRPSVPSRGGIGDLVGALSEREQLIRHHFLLPLGISNSSCRCLLICSLPCFNWYCSAYSFVCWPLAISTLPSLRSPNFRTEHQSA